MVGANLDGRAEPGPRLGEAAAGRGHIGGGHDGGGFAAEGLAAPPLVAGLPGHGATGPNRTVKATARRRRTWSPISMARGLRESRRAGHVRSSHVFSVRCPRNPGENQGR
jgi:hypothetical protein